MVMDFEGENPNVHGNMKTKEDKGKDTKDEAQRIASNSMIIISITFSVYLFSHVL